MAIKTRMLLVTRHGNNKEDELTPESPRAIYQNAGRDLENWASRYQVNQDRAFLHTSGKNRTFHTGMAILAGAFHYDIPHSFQDVEALVNKMALRVIPNPQLDFANIKFSEEKIKKIGLPKYLEASIEHPDATQIGEAEVTPFNDVVRTRGQYLVETLAQLFHPDYRNDLGVIATHSGVIEALAISAVSQGKGNHLDTLRHIGGQFDRGDYFKIEIKGTEDEPFKVGATLQRGNHTRIIDLKEIIQTYRQ